MEMNRQQSQVEVRSFIERQRADARAKAEAMQRDIIRRINEANQNVLQYMDDRAQMKLSRLADALNTFDHDAAELKTSLHAEQFLPAKRIIELRTKYASNMFDERNSTEEPEEDHDDHQHHQTDHQREQPEWEKSFFGNGDKYRMYEELINLRAKWPFLAPALTSIYYAVDKDFSLDDIRTFLEYRHDKVLNLFQEHCKTLSKGISFSSLCSTLINLKIFLPFIILIVGPSHPTVEEFSFYRYKTSTPINQIHDANFDRCLEDLPSQDDYHQQPYHHHHHHQELANSMNESMRL